LARLPETEPGNSSGKKNPPRFCRLIYLLRRGRCRVGKLFVPEIVVWFRCRVSGVGCRVAGAEAGWWRMPAAEAGPF